MAPDVVLDEARKAMQDGDYELAAEKYAALDSWVSAGGFMPGDWVSR